MRIIAHRGAKGLAPENTIESVIAGAKGNADAIEIDIRVSSDEKLVLAHDASLRRTHGIRRNVNDMKVSEIKKVQSPEGFGVPTLYEAMLEIGDKDILIEGKSSDWAISLANFLKTHPKKTQVTVISFDHHALDDFSKLCPETPVYVLEHKNPFDAINAARLHGFNGIDINFWTLNPLAYWLARRHGLDVIVYTVNHVWIARLLARIYPNISITSDIPHKLKFLQRKRRRAKKPSKK